jgi:WD40 repeat protein
MWAQIKISTTKDLPNDDKLIIALETYFGTKRTQIENLAKETTFSFLKEVKYAHSNGAYIFLLTGQDKGALHFFVESRTDRKSLKLLKKHSEEFSRDIVRFLKSESVSISKKDLEKVSAQFYAEDNWIQTFDVLSWGKKFTKSLGEHIAAKLYAPIVTLIVSLIIGYQAVENQISNAKINESFLNVVVSVVAIIIWVVISATVIQSQFEYKE